MTVKLRSVFFFFSIPLSDYHAVRERLWL